MKKISALLLLAIILLTSVACDSSNAAQASETLIVSREKNNRIAEREYSAKDDLVTGLKQTTKLDMTKLDEDMQTVIRESTRQAKSVYEATEGVTYDVTEEGNFLTEIITIDFTENNIQKILELDLIDINVENNRISLSQTKTVLRANGWTIE